MSGDNGVIRIGKKGRRKFAFGDDGAPFEVDVVVAWQQWIAVDESFRPEEDGTPDQDRSIPLERMPEFHQAAVAFVKELATSERLAGDGRTVSRVVPDISVGEALAFVAQLREQYDEVAAFFRPRSREERAASSSSGGTSTRFSEEPGDPATVPN